MSESNVVEYVQSLYARARKAQQEIERYSQSQVDDLCKAIAWITCKEENARELARMAYEESQMGDFEAKVGKFKKKVPGTLWYLRDKKSVGVIEEDIENGIVKIAKPIGVIGALIPSTQPEMTPVIKAMFALKCRNAIVFSPHPQTAHVTNHCVELMRKALKKMGAPEDLLVCAQNPNLAMSNEIMRQADMVVATGGHAMVIAAYSSGKPAYGCGVGNSNVIIAEDADLKDAAAKITVSKTFDNASGCSCENSIIVHESIYNDMIAALVAEGAYMCNAEEKAKLQATLWKDGILDRSVITRPIQTIAGKAGIQVPVDCKYVMVEETGSGPNYPFSGEKLSLILTVYRYKNLDDAIDIINNNQAYQGPGHSCGIHTFNEEYIERVAMNTKTVRVQIRQGMNTANSGDYTNGMPWTVTLGCGTWGGNSASENITYKHFMNTTWVSRPIEGYIPTMEEIFGDFMD